MEDLTGILAILLIFGGPLIMALGIGGLVVSNNRSKQAERERSRETFERVTRDKLDVIKTAIVMGMAANDINDLDTRLERLIGAEQMKSLLLQAPVVPVVTAEMMDADLVSEVETQRRKQRDHGDS